MSADRNPAPGRPPAILVVMGVSGSGKSTVAARLAERLGWDFVDGDSFHSPGHVARMRAGHPLDDGDRAPWLAAIGAWIDTHLREGRPGVVVCSALRRSYRDGLVRGRDAVRIVFLDGPHGLIAERLARRQGHFMPPALLASQFAALEPPEPEENAVAVGIDATPGAVVAAILDRLGLRARGSDGAPGIALVISDVDGTLVTTDKRLTPATLAAVHRLKAAGIAFTIASSRPPVGLRALARALDLTLPMGAFNGSTVVAPDLTVLSEALIPAEAAREAARRFAQAGLDIWVFAGGHWNLTDPHGPYTDLERRTLQTEPTVVADLAPLLDRAAKIVGVGADAAYLEACEAEIAAALAGRADVHRSQAYYLDVTPPGSGKAGFVDAMSRHLGLDRARIATLGDAGNDVPMFARSGFSVAMGNAIPAVRAAARAVTGTNDADGFARAVDEFILRPGDVGPGDALTDP